MKKQIIKYTLIVATLVVAFLAWYSIDRLIAGYGSYWWLGALFLFGAYFILICLDILLIEKKLTLLLLIPISFLISWIFTLDILHLIVPGIIFLIVWHFINLIRKDLKSIVFIDLNKVFYIRKLWLIVALALAVAGQYYFQVKDLPEQKIVPKFKMNDISKTLIVTTLGQYNPAFYTVEEENATVNQFLLENYSQVKSQSQSQSQEGSTIGGAVKEVNREEFLAEGLAQISTMAGRQVNGNEKIDDVFPEIVNKQLEEHMVKEDPSGPELTAPALALILFLSILGLGSLLGYFLVLGLRIIFWFFKKFRWVRFTKVPVEMEVID
jgi:hypothetical protein